jgi:DNA repair exonuclease SbcCD nuclease subunit
VKNKLGESIGVIAACGHEGPREGRNLAELFPMKEGELPWVGLLHTDVSGCLKGDEDRYAPCTLKDLQNKGYSYWALGHIHKRQELCDNPPIVYPGNIMGRNPKECGPKGVYLVEADKSRVSCEFIPVAPVVWSLIKEGDIKGRESLEELKGCIKASVLENDDSLAGERRLLRILLQGPTPLYDDLQSEENLEELERTLEQELNVDGVELKTEELEPCAYPEDYKGEAHVLGEALSMLEELEGNPEELLKMMAGQMAMDNPKWKDEDRLNYLKELLRGMDIEITSRLAGGIKK